MAAQDWNFAVLDDEYNQLNGGPWAGLNGFANAQDLEDVGAHWYEQVPANMMWSQSDRNKVVRYLE